MGGGGLMGNFPLCAAVVGKPGLGSNGGRITPVDRALSNWVSAFVAKLMASVKEYIVCIETRSCTFNRKPPTNLATCCASVSDKLFLEDNLLNSST